MAKATEKGTGVREDRLERWVDRGLVTIAVAFGCLALLNGLYLVATSATDGALKRMFYLSLPGLLALGFRLLANLVWKQRLILLLYLIATCELILQAAAGLGLIPRVHVYKHVPYGRIYYTREGFANGWMNRYGWHATPFEDQPEVPKVALIGDSFVLAAGVPARQNAGALLQERLASSPSSDHPRAVLSMGISNTGPAEYLEVLRYAQRHFQPREAIVAIFVGNDFRNLLAPDEKRRRERDIYYQLDESGHLSLLPESQQARRDFVSRLEYNHRNPLWLLPLIVRSHFLSSAVLQETRTVVWERVNQLVTGAMPATVEEENLAKEMRWLGLDAFVFEDPPGAEAEAMMALGLSLLDASFEFAEAHGMRLRLVTIPVVPPSFYARHQGTDWSFRQGGYDLELPERRLVAHAEANGVPILPLARTLREKGLDVDEIRSLYFNGYGHFSHEGQRFLADALWERFYAPAAQAKGTARAGSGKARASRGLTP